MRSGYVRIAVSLDVICMWRDLMSMDLGIRSMEPSPGPVCVVCFFSPLPSLAWNTSGWGPPRRSNRALHILLLVATILHYSWIRLAERRSNDTGFSFDGKKNDAACLMRARLYWARSRRKAARKATQVWRTWWEKSWGHRACGRESVPAFTA